MTDLEVLPPSISSEKQFDILNPQDYETCMAELSSNQNLFDLMRKGFQLKYDVTRGLQFDELEDLIKSEHGPDAQRMLEEVQRLSEGQSTWIGTTLGNPTKRDTILIYGELIDGKYDVLNVRATQVKKLDEQKLVAYGIGAVCAGVLVGSFATPIVGAITGASILAAGSAKAVHEYRKSLPDVIYGYIFKELTDKNIITSKNGNFRI